MSTPERQQDDDHELGGYGGTHVDPESSELIDPGSTTDGTAPGASGVDYPAHPNEPEPKERERVAEKPAR